MNYKIFCLIFTLILSSFVYSADLKDKTNLENILCKEYDLSKKGSNEVQYFIQTSELLNYTSDGKRLAKDIFKLYLKFNPSADGNKNQYECLRFSVQFGDSGKQEIPSLKNMKYTFLNGIDENNNVFGINHAKFDNLTDSKGNQLPPDKAYYVYNSFIDFHGLCNVFAEKTAQGNGIQHLKKIGEKIIHAAAFSKPPTNLGKNVIVCDSFKIIFKSWLEYNSCPKYATDVLKCLPTLSNLFNSP